MSCAFEESLMNKLSIKRIRQIVREQILREAETFGRARQRAEVNGIEVSMNWDPSLKSYVIKVSPGAESTRKLSVGEPTEVTNPSDSTFLAGTDASRALAAFVKAKELAAKSGDVEDTSRILRKNMYTPKALQYEMKLGIGGRFGGASEEEEEEHSRDFPLSYIVATEPDAIAALREWLKDRVDNERELESAITTARFHYEDSGRLETMLKLPPTSDEFSVASDMGLIDLIWDEHRMEWVPEEA